MFFSRNIKCALVLLALLLSADTVCAKDAVADINDDEIEDDLEDFYGDEDFVSIATGSVKSISKAPAVASVITADDILKMGARNLTEVLDTVPGIHVSRSGQQVTPEFWFRGITSTFNPQTLFMINGVSIKSVVRGDNHTVWGEFPVQGIERIEIIRGPGSALYGADAFSGVINVITKSQTEQQNKVGGMVGSFNTYNVWANYGVTVDDWKLAMNFEYLQTDGYEGYIESDAQSIVDIAAAPLNIPPASKAPGELSTGFEATDLWISAENSLIKIDAGTQRRDNLGTGQGATEVLDPLGKLASYKNIVKFTLKEIQVSDELYVKSNINYYGSSQEIEENLHLFPQGAFFGTFPDGFIGNPGWEEESMKVELDSRYLGFESNEVTFGLGYERQNLYKVVEHKNFNPDFTPRIEGLTDVSDTAEIFIPEAARENRFAYFQIISQLAPDWELTSGGRYDDYTDFGSTFNPRVALVWSTSLKLTSKLLYGRAFRAPAFAETTVVNNPIALGNPALKPETIDTYELAFDYNFSSELSFDMNLFFYKIEDFITFVPDGNGLTATAQNLGERTGTGLEAAVEYDVSNQLKVYANFAYVDAQDDLVDDEVGEYPGFQSYLRADWNVSDNWTLGGQLTLVGERERISGDSRENMDGYNLLSLSTTYKFSGSGTRIQLVVSNALDEDISEPSSASTTFGQINLPNDIPQAGAAGYLRVSTRF